jgi:hypothetical protein
LSAKYKTTATIQAITEKMNCLKDSPKKKKKEVKNNENS